eukprot:4231113-Pleurochrysis_carterae.AAC.1
MREAAHTGARTRTGTGARMGINCARWDPREGASRALGTGVGGAGACLQESIVARASKCAGAHRRAQACLSMRGHAWARSAALLAPRALSCSHKSRCTGCVMAQTEPHDVSDATLPPTCSSRHPRPAPVATPDLLQSPA